MASSRALYIDANLKEQLSGKECQKEKVRSKDSLSKVLQSKETSLPKNTLGGANTTRKNGF